MKPLRSTTLVPALASLLMCQMAAGVNLFDISFDFGTGENAVPEAYQPMFIDAANIWKGIIPSYIDGNYTEYETVVPGLAITAGLKALGGVGGILAESGGILSARDDGHFELAWFANINLDSNDAPLLSGGQLTAVIAHEIGHALGFGTLWEANGLYVPGKVVEGSYVPGSGEYKVGSAATTAYKTEFNSGATFVPVETSGGKGTADAHWQEIAGGLSDTGWMSGTYNKDMRYELMTGWLNFDPSNQYFISDTTVASFRDLGYNTNSGGVFNAVPELSTLSSGFLLLLGVVRRRREARCG
ncbi:MAG: peptidase [Verrucomicrobia bacterium]|nr:peptidase [Verrucomicrobiota bacterium]